MISASEEMNINKVLSIDSIQKGSSEFIDYINQNSVETILKQKDPKVEYTSKVYHLLFGEIVDPDCLYIFEEKFPYEFKLQNRFNFFKKLLTTFPITESFITDINQDVIVKLLKILVKIGKGQYLLRLINLEKIFELEYIKVLGCFDIYFTSGISSTLPVFLEIDKYVELKTYNKNNKDILTAASRNSDIRVLKHIVNNFNKYHNSTLNSKEYISVLLNQIFAGHIPIKYSLRRMKIISSKIDFVPHFNLMVSIVPDIDSFFILNKIYNADKKFVFPENYDPGHIVNLILNKGDAGSNSVDFNNCKETSLKVLDCLSSKYDKFNFAMILFVVSTSFFGIDIENYYENTPAYHNLCSKVNARLIDFIFHTKENKLLNLYKSGDLKKIFSFKQPILDRYLKFKNAKKLLFLMPFVNFYQIKGNLMNSFVNINNEAITVCRKLNFIKFKIKVWMRRNFKIIKLESSLKKFRNEDIKPINRQKFSSIPPRHILPMELKSFNQTDEGYCIVREKADGCIVDFISKDIQPLINEYTNKVIKAEFIEDLDLYLIFDIDIKDMGYLERYNYLRSLHPDTQNCLFKGNFIETFADFKNAVHEERELFNKFLNKPYNNYRVYPKASWVVGSISSEINNVIIENIFGEKDYKFICEEGEYQNDGLIITPLDGSRELKIKPKSLMTIDILMKDKKWIDREGNDLSNIVLSKGNYSNDSIWRCYPTNEFNENGQIVFEPREFRYDKEKPNKCDVINMISKLTKLDYNDYKDKGESYYYQVEPSNLSEEWMDICSEQFNILDNVIDKVNPDIKLKWLDLGCGSSKLIKIIKKYSPSKYLGVDIDIKSLLRGMKKIESNNEFNRISKLVAADLKEEWENGIINWSNFDSEKFDYIICNFSFSHFYNDKFWIKLEKYCKSGSTLIFNLINENINTSWKRNSNYIYKDGDLIKYKFEVNNKEIEEQFISESIIREGLSLNNWKLLEIWNNSGESLSSKYSWYIAEHN